MNKKHLMIAIALLSCLPLYSQKTWNWDDNSSNRDKSYRIEIGPKLGVGMAFGSNPTTYSFSFKPGMAYQAGLSANAHFGRRQQQSTGGTGLFGLEAEVMYEGRTLGTTANNLRMHCIEIPVLAQFYPIPSLAIEVGPTFSKILKCSPEQLQFDDIILNTGRLTSSDVMLTAGLAYKAPFGLMLDLRYNYGLLPLAGNLDSKLSSLMVSMTYLFKIVK